MEPTRVGSMPIVVDWNGLGVGALGFVAIVAVAANDGGYFPESWSWLAALTLLPAAIILLATNRLRLGLLGLAYVGLLAAFGAWALLSSAWSGSATSSVLEAQRSLAYVGVALLASLLVQRRTAPQLLGGVLGGVTVVTGYGFLTRVLPDRIGVFDSIAGYRLSDPIGYWNGLGVFAAMGAELPINDPEELPTEVGADPAELTVERLDLADALDRLEPRDRELVALRYGADLKAREIGDLLHMSTGAVEVALHRALGRLREML